MNRRSRVSKGQSKYGCFTCKSRKVKCDETKPSCLRCQRAHRVCEGYPERAHESPSNTGSPAALPVDDRPNYAESYRAETPSSPSTTPGSPIVPSDLGFTDEEKQHIKLALRIVFRPQVDDFQYAYEPLRNRLFQFDTLCPSTKAAAATVGAIAEQLTQPDNKWTRATSARAHALYIRSIQLLRQDLVAPQSHTSSLLLSTILLMSAELMLARRQNALKHLHGAAQVLNATAADAQLTDGPAKNDIELAHRAIDILRLSYTNYTRNTITPVSHGMPQDISELSGDIKLFDKHVLETVHAGFCFITTSALAICRKEPLEDLQIEQKQHLVDISQCLDEITRLLTHSDISDQAHIFRLRCMCLSMFIEISTLFAESETIWDAYAHQFEQIVLAAEAVLEARSTYRSKLPPNLPVFSLQLGIVQPLYLVAMKYRHRTWRRKAILLLQEAGQDGPWKGSLLATIALWCTQVEEATEKVPRPPESTFEYQAANLTSLSPEPEAVLEDHRIAVCRFLEDTVMLPSDDDNILASVMPRSINVKLLRRRMAVGAIPARVLSPVGMDSIAESEQLMQSRIARGEWEEWTESIPI